MTDQPSQEDRQALQKLSRWAQETGLNIAQGTARRSSSRFCLGVEHGDYNGTELFGVGTDRFIWLAYKPNGTQRVRLFSANFPDEGVVDFALGQTPSPQSDHMANRWARFPMGVDYILRQEGFALKQGIDGVLYGNIPGGGMSRSASLTLNLILSLLDANGLKIDDPFKLVDMAQAVENTYIGSPCGQLDQIMILFARAGMGTHYDPANRHINYVPVGDAAEDFRLVVLDTGTQRPGLEKSTYKIRRAECDDFAAQLKHDGYPVEHLGDVKDQSIYDKIISHYQATRPDWCDRFRYIFQAQQRFAQMLTAWKNGDIATVGSIFRQDGIGLRDDYKLSGPELETMCDIARTVPGVLGERMLGGGDKGASGALVQAASVGALQQAITRGYRASHQAYADKFALHICNLVDGIKLLQGLL